MRQTTFPLSLLPALFAPLLIPTSLAYKWPNPKIDEADRQLYNQFGYKGNQIFGVIPVCGRSPAPNSGRQIAAEWLRTAFHDMATHDASAGTGGLDGSIAVEADRAENSGMGGTVGFFLNFLTDNLSLADLLALGVRSALDTCGGPEVPYRVGRVDNITPGPFGVPMPQESLQSHMSSFSRMGFNREEAIGLVACGHTIGGVHAAFSPDIVQQAVVHFDSTFDVYDNKIATEFVSGVRNNPLAFGNDATNSDFRIFSSDGNATISSFAASQDTFFSTCASLLARMVDTVPSGVTLSDVITPIPVKPSLFIDIQQDGSLSVTGEVRFFDISTNPNRVVKFAWLDRDGQCQVQGGCSVTATHDDTHVTTTKRDKQAVWYSFSATIDSTASISKFWFEVDEGDGSGSKQVNSENGSPFPVEDRLFIIPSKTCQQFNDGANVAVTFAVRSGSQIVDPKLVGGSFTITTPTYTRADISAAATLASNSTSPNYQLYTANFQSSSSFQFDIVAQLDGQNVKDAGWSTTDINTSPFQCSS